MKSTFKSKGSVPSIFKTAAFALPLVATALPAHAAAAPAAWVSTETRAFLTPEQMRTFAATPEAQATAGEAAHVVVSLRVRHMAKLKALGQAVN